jgi:hypothetical protein
MLSAGLLGSVPYSEISDCKGCKLAKFSALPFHNKKSTTVFSAPFDLIHSDVWGQAPLPTKNRKKVSKLEIHPGALPDGDKRTRGHEPVR